MSGSFCVLWLGLVSAASFTVCLPHVEHPWQLGMVQPLKEPVSMMVGLSMAMFVALFGWGAGYFGWHDPAGKVQLALFTAFILGAVCGYKSKG
jgi:hypothetical protein